MEFVLWIIFGGLIGWAATLIMGKDAHYGVIANILFGIVGSFVGGLLFSFFGATVGGFNLISIVASLVGASLTVWGFSKVKKTA